MQIALILCNGKVVSGSMQSIARQTGVTLIASTEDKFITAVKLGKCWDAIMTVPDLNTISHHLMILDIIF